MSLETKYEETNQNIKYFPNFILELDSLKILNLSNNLLVQIPNKIYELTNLEELYLKNNNLKKIHDGICKLKNLHTLNISSNNISIISNQINKLVNLESLNLSNNNLSSLPLSFYKLCNLKNLDLSNNNFKYINISICKLRGLEKLNLKNNKITYLTKNIKYLTNLKILLINNNFIDKLPEEIQSMDNLEEINIENNAFKKFPVRILQIPRLIYLYNQDNQPFNIDELRKKYLSNNNLDFLKIQVKDYKVSYYLNKLWNFKEVNNPIFNTNNNKINELLDIIKNKNKKEIDNNLIKLLDKDSSKEEFSKRLIKNSNELEKIDIKPYEFEFKENVEMNKFKPAIKLVFPLISKNSFINKFKENIEDIYKKTLDANQVIFKKLEDGKKKTKTFSQDDFDNIFTDLEIELIYNYIHSSLLKKKYILNNICFATITPIFKFTKNDLQDPTSFRYFINYNKIVRVIDKLWCIDILSKCKDNIPSRKIFKSNLLYYNFTKIVKTATKNTNDINNIIIIDIDKAYDSVSWKLIKKLLFINISRKINKVEAKKLIDEYFLILSNTTIYYNNKKIKLKHGLPIGLASSNIIFNFMIEEVTLRWLYNIKDYIKEFRINIYVDDIFFKFYKTENANFIINSFISHFKKYNLNINKNKFKVSSNLKINLKCCILKSNDFYLGLPFTRNIQLYGKLILKEYQKKYLHTFTWDKIYKKITTNDINSSSILGYLGYKLRPFLEYDKNYNIKIIKFIKENYL